MANQGDVILYSDWNAIQTVIYEQIGPLQEVAGDPGVYVPGVGYGLSQAQLHSRPYPFTRNIVSISSEAQATVEFDIAHRLVVDEVIFFTNFSNTWGGLGISNNFAKVITVLSDTRIIVDFNTFSYTPWNSSVDTAEAVQYFISANQFANLRTDLAKAVQHITGQVPANGNNFPGGESSRLPIPVKGDIIYHSVYDPYYIVATACETYKFVAKEINTDEPNMPGSASNTNAWNDLTEYEIKLTWPTTFDFVQYFNTGGLIKIDMLNIALSNPATDPQNTRDLNDAWEDLMTSVFPVYFGAKSQAAMGLSGSADNFTRSGAFDMGGSYVEVYYQDYSNNPYSSSYDDHFIRIQCKQNIYQKDLQFKITLNDSSSGNAYATNVAIDRTLQLYYIHSIGSIPLAIDPANDITLQRISGWT